MNKFVICYVPGSGGVKLERLLDRIESVENFSQLKHSHNPIVPKFVKPLDLITSIEQQIGEKKLTPLVAGDSDSQILFLGLDQNKLVGPDNKAINCFYSTKQNVTSHCMSAKLVSMRYPDRFQIKIFCDIALSLRRWWVVYAQHKNMTIPQISLEFETLLKGLNEKEYLVAGLIIMHLEYYSKYFDTGADFFLNLETDQDEFSLWMRQDLALCKDSCFDNVWSHLLQHNKISQWYDTLKNKKILDNLYATN